jgi:hypothetical protein
MSDHLVPQVAIELDKVRHLQFDFNSASAFEEATGKSVFEVASIKGMGARDMRAFIWACLIHEDESLTIKQVGSMIHMGNLAYVSEKFLAIYNTSTPEPEEGKTRPLAQ